MFALALRERPTSKGAEDRLAAKMPMRLQDRDRLRGERDLPVYLIRVCLDAARRRYVELKEFLEEKRAAPPR
jgi:hypothetical protein